MSIERTPESPMPTAKKNNAVPDDYSLLTRLLCYITEANWVAVRGRCSTRVPGKRTDMHVNMRGTSLAAHPRMFRIISGRGAQQDVEKERFQPSESRGELVPAGCAGLDRGRVSHHGHSPAPQLQPISQGQASGSAPPAGIGHPAVACQARPAAMVKLAGLFCFLAGCGVLVFPGGSASGPSNESSIVRRAPRSLGLRRTRRTPSSCERG